MTSPIVIRGELLQNARSAFRRSDGQWLLLMDVRPPVGADGRDVTARVQQTYGTGDAAAVACRNRANRLKRGVRVIVHASGACLRAGRIDLSPVDLIEEPDLVNLHERIAG